MPFDFTDRVQLEAFDEHCIQYGRRLNMLTRIAPRSGFFTINSRHQALLAQISPAESPSPSKSS